jgi:hypothetical protein
MASGKYARNTTLVQNLVKSGVLYQFRLFLYHSLKRDKIYRSSFFSRIKALDTKQSTIKIMAGRQAQEVATA